MVLPSPSAKRRLGQAAKHYHDQLDAAALAYFESRGFTPAMCRTLGFGYAGDCLPGHEFFQGRVTVPYLTPTGTVQIKFRCIDRHDCKLAKCPKYLGISGAGLWMYNTKAFLVDSPIIAITEGELDAGATHLLTGIPTVGFPGTQSATNGEDTDEDKPARTTGYQHWFRAFVGYQRVLVIGDGDKQGRAAANAVAKQLTQADVVHLPAKEDANSLLIQPGGVEHFRELCGLDEGDSA